MNRRYIIGTGYCDNTTQNGIERSELMKYWVRNNRATANPRAQFVLSMHGSSFSHPDVKEINVVGNLGHYSDLLEGRKTHAFSGAGAAIMTLAMVAYCDESDFIYKEQDSLAFGNWVEHLYSECRDYGAVIGNPEPCPSGTALMLFRHERIPEIISAYIHEGPENNIQNLVEHHYHAIAEKNPELVGFYKMGYDKKRPVNFDDETFWIQQPNLKEIDELKRRNLL